MSVQTQSVLSQPVFGPVDWTWYVVLSLLRVGSIGAFGYYWCSSPALWREAPLGHVVATVLIGIPVLGNLLRWGALPFMRRPVEMKARPGYRVAVVTTCVPAVEPPEMVERTVAALVRFRVDHDTWLLDEGDDPVLREACARLGARHFTRKYEKRYQTKSGPFAAGWKHGNYNAWLDRIGYEAYDIVISVDPDHLPVNDFTEALGYFDDPAVAYVQTPQAYSNQSESLVARGAAEETYGYYSYIQMAAFGAGQPVLTGCHNGQRVRALREAGGFPDHAAEDILLTVRYQGLGWRGVYLPRIFFEGLAPSTWAAYVTQQIRWARSVADVKIRHFRKAGSQSFVARTLNILQGFGYFQDAIVASLGVGSLGVMLAGGGGMPRLAGAQKWYLAALAATFLGSDYFKQRFYLAPGREAGLHWCAGILRLAKWPCTVLALWQAVRNSGIGYEVTPKIRTTAQKRLLFPHCAILIWLMGAFWMGHHRGLPPTALTLAAAVVGVFSLSMIIVELSAGL